jgi:hypothetical protein
VKHHPDAAPPDCDPPAIALTVALALALCFWRSSSGSLALALSGSDSLALTLALGFALHLSYCGVTVYGSAVAGDCGFWWTGLIVAMTEACFGLLSVSVRAHNQLEC